MQQKDSFIKSLLPGEAAFHTLVQVCVDSIYPAGNVTTLQASPNTQLCLIRDSLTSGGLDSIVTYDMISCGPSSKHLWLHLESEEKGKIQITPYEEAQDSGVFYFGFQYPQSAITTE